MMSIRIFAVTTALFTVSKQVFSIDSDNENQQCENPDQPVCNNQKQPTFPINGVYDVWNCPEHPPPNYPTQWKAVDILSNWNPDDLTIPAQVYQGICVFNFFEDYDKAMNYLMGDVPFIVRGTPDFGQAAERWSQSDYLDELLKNRTYAMYKSKSSQFQYYGRMESPPPGWEPPTEYSRVTYDEFQNLSYEAAPNETHYYLYVEGRWSAVDERFRWPLFDEFPRFKPGNTDLFHELFHQDYQTLYCKIAMAGNTAIMHFDKNRNTIVMVKGRRRYILADPTQCPKLHLRDKSHPSHRHTTLDLRAFPKDNDALMNEVLIEPGDALILPSFWFHSVVGLTPENIQCSVWSTGTVAYKSIIQECGDFWDE